MWRVVFRGPGAGDLGGCTTKVLGKRAGAVAPEVTLFGSSLLQRNYRMQRRTGRERIALQKQSRNGSSPPWAQCSTPIAEHLHDVTRWKEYR